MDWAVVIMRQGLTILIMAVVVLGVIRPLINRIMVPAAQGGPGEAVISLEDDVDLDTVEIQEGESRGYRRSSAEEGCHFAGDAGHSEHL